MQNWFFVFALLMSMLGMQLSLNGVILNQAQGVSLASSELDDYRLFLYVASAFMSRASPGAAELYWSDISNVATLPAALKAHRFSSLWRVLVLADQSWVVCAPLSEKALGMQTQLMSAHGVNWLPIDPSLQTQVTHDQLRYMDTASQSKGLCQ